MSRHRRRNPILSVRRPKLGMRVRVVVGSGVDSGKAGVIVGWSQVKTDGRGKPTNIQGEYWTASMSRERGMVPVRLDNGELILMFKNRLTQVGANPSPYRPAADVYRVSPYIVRWSDGTWHLMSAQSRRYLSKRSFNTMVAAQRALAKIYKGGGRNPHSMLSDYGELERRVRTWREMEAFDKKHRIGKYAKRKGRKRRNPQFYRTFKRSATGWQSFARARKMTQDTGLTWAQARASCDQYNASRTPAQIRKGTKLEFEAM